MRREREELGRSAAQRDVALVLHPELARDRFRGGVLRPNERDQAFTYLQLMEAAALAAMSGQPEEE